MAEPIDLSLYAAQPLPAIDAALEIEAVDGEVVFIGPGAVAFAMTRAAAQQTLSRLRDVLDDGEARLDGEEPR